jgi:dTDP-L-rhamnose 4-epimerase
MIFGDVCDENVVHVAVDGVDAVCHQAAMVGLGESFLDVSDYVRANDLGTANLLRMLYAGGFRGRFVLGSSMVVYGEGRYRCPTHGSTPPPPRDIERLRDGDFEPLCPTCGSILDPLPTAEDQSPDPRNVYAATKLHQEHLCQAFGRAAGASVILLRYHNVYGPRMARDSPYAGVASVFRSALQQNEPPRVFEDGRQLRDFVHVHDVARANLMALGASADVSGPINVASGDVRSVGEMAQALVSATGGPDPEITGRFRLGDVRHVFASPDRARETLGFKASVDFSSGMQDFASAPLREPVAAIRD